MEKGDKCEYGICPHGNHNVLINRNNDKYPGFLTKELRHQMENVLFVVLENHRLIKVFIKDVLNIEDEKNTDIKYIGRRDKLKLPEGRYGLIPKEIQLFLEQEENQPGNLKNGFNGFVRKGLNYLIIILF